MGNSTPTYDQQSLLEGIEEHLQHFAECTLDVASYEDNSEMLAIFRKFISPPGLVYMFAFISAVYTKHGHAESIDACRGMGKILATSFRVPTEDAVSLVDIGVTNAISGAKEYMEGKRSLFSIAYRYGNEAGKNFIAGESHLDILDPYTLIILSS